MVIDRTHPLPSGARVRVRIARPSDHAGLAELFARLELPSGDMDVRRALRFVPGRRSTVVATRWDGRHDQIVGFGAIEDGEVRVLLGSAAVRDLLVQALHEPWSRRVA